MISRFDTIEIYQRYGLKNMRFTQIGANSEEKAKNQSVLTSLARSIIEYLSETNNGVVLIEGIDILIAENGFKRVNVLLEQISDFAGQYHSYLIMPIDPKSLSERETEKIGKIFEAIRVGEAPALG